MRIPINPLQRSVAPSIPGGTALARTPQFSGLATVGNALEGVGKQRERDAAIAENQFAQLEHEQRKARVLERVSNDRLKWTEQLQARQTEAAPGAEGFTPAVAKEFDAYSEQALKDIKDQDEREMYKGMLGQVREHVLSRAIVFEGGQRRDYRKQVLTEGVNTDAKTVGVDPSQFNDVLAQRLAAINTSSDLQADERAALAKVASDTLSTNAAQTMADRDPLGFLRRIGERASKVDKSGKPVPVDAVAAAQLVASDPILSRLPQHALRAIADRAATTLVHEQAQREAEAERAARRAEIFANKREREANQAFTILSTWAREGKTADQVSAAPLLKALSGTPYQAAYAGMAQDAAQHASAAALPIDAQQYQLDGLMTRRNTAGTSQALETEIKARQTIIDAAKRDFKDDAPGAMLERGLIKSIPPVDITKPETLKARADLMSLGEAFTGQPVSPLRPAEAEQFKQMIGKLAPVEKESVVKQVYGAMGAPAAMELFKQVGKDAPLLTIAGGLAGQQTVSRSRFMGFGYGPQTHRSVSQLMFEGEDLLKNKQVTLPEGPKFNAAFQDYVGNAIPTPAAREMAAAAAQSIYAKLAFEAGKYNEKGVDTGILKQAAEFVTGRVIDYNGSKILPPVYGMPEDKAREVLRGVTPAQVKAWGGVVGMSDEQAAEYIRSAPLESQSVGKYRVLAGSGILQRKDGKPFEMRF